MNALAKAAPFMIRTLITDNGTEFTDRLFGGQVRAPSREHGFDLPCQALDIGSPNHPQTNGMAERCNGWIAQVNRTANSS